MAEEDFNWEEFLELEEYLEKEKVAEEFREKTAAEEGLILFHLFFRYEDGRVVANNAPFRDVHRSMPILFYNVLSESARRILKKKYGIDLDEEYWKKRRETIERRRKIAIEEERIPPALETTYQILDATRLKGIFCPLTFSQDKLCQGNTRILLATSPEEVRKNLKEKRYFNPILYNAKIPGIEKPYLYNHVKRLNVSLWGYLTCVPFLVYDEKKGDWIETREYAFPARLPKNREEMELTFDGSCIVSENFIRKVKLIPVKSRTRMVFYDFEISPKITEYFGIEPSHPYAKNFQIVTKGTWLGETQRSSITGIVTVTTAYPTIGKKRLEARKRLALEINKIRDHEIPRLKKKKKKADKKERRKLDIEIRKLEERLKRLEKRIKKMIIPKPARIILNYPLEYKIIFKKDSKSKLKFKKNEIVFRNPSKKITTVWSKFIRSLYLICRVRPEKNLIRDKEFRKKLQKEWNKKGEVKLSATVFPVSVMKEYTVERNRLIVGDKLQSMSGLKTVIAKIDPKLDQEGIDIVINSNQLREKTKPETGKRGMLELEIFKTGKIKIFIRPVTFLEYGTSNHGVRLSNTTIQTLLSIKQYDERAYKLLTNSLLLEPKQDVRKFMIPRAKPATWRAGYIYRTKRRGIAWWRYPDWFGEISGDNEIVVPKQVLNPRVPTRVQNFIKFYKSQFRNVVSHPKCRGIYRRVIPHDWHLTPKKHLVFGQEYPKGQEKYSIYEIGLCREDWEELGRPKFVLVEREPCTEPSNIKIMQVYLLPETDKFIARIDIRAMADMFGDHDGDSIFITPFRGTASDAFYLWNVLYELTENCKRGREKCNEMLKEMMTHDEFKKVRKIHPLRKAYKNDDELWEAAVHYNNNRILDGKLYQFVGGLKNRVFFEIYDRKEVWGRKPKYNLSEIQQKLNIECFHPDYKILTKDGWKQINEVTLKDEICTLNPETHIIEYVKPKYIFSTAVDTSKMLACAKPGFNLLVTNEHRIYAREKGKKKFKLYKYEDLPDEFYIKTNAEYNKKGRDYIIIPPVKKSRIAFIVPSPLFAEFLGFWLSEGTMCNNKNNHYIIYISQSEVNKHIADRIQKCLNSLPFGVTIDRGNTNYLEMRFRFGNKALYQWLKQNAITINGKKRIPRIILNNLSKENLKILFKTLLLGDGNKTGTMFYSNTREFREDFLELLLKIGLSGKINGDYVTVRRHRHEIFVRKKDIKHVKYKGRVYGIELPKNHIVFAMLNGTSYWIGNCYCKEWLRKHPELEWRKTEYDGKKLKNTLRQQMNAVINAVLDDALPNYLHPRSQFSPRRSRDTLPKLLESMAAIPAEFERDTRRVLNELRKRGIQTHTRFKMRYDVMRALCLIIYYDILTKYFQETNRIHQMANRKDIWLKTIKYFAKRQYETELRFAREFTLKDIDKWLKWISNYRKANVKISIPKEPGKEKVELDLSEIYAQTRGR